jgi:putative transposase
VGAAHRANALFDAHRDDPEFGYRLLADEARDAGQDMCDRTAWAICSGNAWWSVFGKKRSKKNRPGPPAHDDLVQRDFTATGPNQLWLTDITSTAPVRARCTCAPSRTCGPTGSSGTPSAHG